MYALTKPHGPCRGSSGSDMHKQVSQPLLPAVSVHSRPQPSPIAMPACRSGGAAAAPLPDR